MGCSSASGWDLGVPVGLEFGVAFVWLARTIGQKESTHQHMLFVNGSSQVESPTQGERFA